MISFWMILGFIYANMQTTGNAAVLFATNLKYATSGGIHRFDAICNDQSYQAKAFICGKNQDVRDIINSFEAKRIVDSKGTILALPDADQSFDHIFGEDGVLESQILTWSGKRSPDPTMTGCTADGHFANLNRNCNDWSSSRAKYRIYCGNLYFTNIEYLHYDGRTNVCTDTPKYHILCLGRETLQFTKMTPDINSTLQAFPYHIILKFSLDFTLAKPFKKGAISIKGDNLIWDLPESMVQAELNNLTLNFNTPEFQEIFKDLNTKERDYNIEIMQGALIAENGIGKNDEITALFTVNPTQEKNYTTLTLLVIVLSAIVIILVTICLLVWHRLRDKTAFWEANNGKYAHKESFLPDDKMIRSKPKNMLKNPVRDSKRNGIDYFRGSPIFSSNKSISRNNSISDDLFSVKSNINPAWEIDMSDVRMGKVIGRGAAGLVYEGYYFDQEVAIKTLPEYILHGPNLEINDQVIKEFYHEAEVWARLRFKNVVQLYGVCTQQAPGNNFCMVMELCKWNLFDFLHKPHVSPQLKWTRRLEIAKDVASGVFYLHSQNILHRDLKSANVLLTVDGTVKICDFGMAKIKDTITNTAESGVKGTPQWLAPEVSLGGSATTKSDVYSFGIILWEIASRKPPFYDQEQNIFTLVHEIIGGCRPTLDLFFPAAIKQSYQYLLTQCWHADCKQRPEFKNIIDQLNMIQDILKGRDSKQLIENRNKAEIIIKNAEEAYFNQKFDTAKALYKQCIELYCTEDALSRLWQIYMEQNDYQSALQTAKQFQKLFPSCHKGYEKAGDTCYRQNNFTAAEKHFSKALHYEPYEVRLQDKLAKCQDHLI